MSVPQQPCPPAYAASDPRVDPQASSPWGDVFSRSAQMPEPSPETAPLLGRSRSKTNRTKIGSILLVVLLLLPLAVLNGVQYAGYIYVRSATSTAQAQLSVTRTQLASVRHERVREEATWTAERRWRADQRALEDAAWTAETKRRTNLRVREELDWAAERRHRAQQAAREEAAWAAEGRQRAAQRARENTEWAAENERRKEQRWREDAEKRDAEERARMNLYWDVPQRGEHCARYGAREYSARLFNIKDGYDWVTACERTPVVIHGNVIAKPDWCQVRDGVWGHWVVPFQEPDCNAAWSREYDMGCIGTGSGVRQIEARLDWVHRNENSYHLCTTAPRTVRNVHFDQPHHCFERDRFMWAMWEVKDATC